MKRAKSRAVAASAKTFGPGSFCRLCHLSPQVGRRATVSPSSAARSTTQSTWAKYFSFGRRGSFSTSGRSP